MKRFIIFLLLILSTKIYGKVDCNKHKIYCQIVANKSNINRKYAMKLSNIIYRLAKKYNVDARIYTAILAQESMYKLDALNCIKGIAYLPEKKELDPIGRWFVVCTDVGISQIHYNTIMKYKFNVNKLTTDLEYSVEAGIKVLASFKKKYAKEDKNYWTRYNSSNKIYREIYRNLVLRYF